MMRHSRLQNTQLQIEVCGKLVKESECEKILGILVNNKLTWSNYLLGDYSDPDKPITGLISQLSKRVGMLTRLSNIIPKERFKSLAHGLFFSKLLYCLPLFGYVWGIEKIQSGPSRNNSFTKSNLRALQILQNKILRLITNSPYDMPVKEMLKQADILSVN